MRAPSLAAVTLLLDVLGLLLVAAGVCAALWVLIGPAALTAAGAVVLGGSALSSALARRKPRER